jgi:hypothetical protein
VKTGIQTLVLSSRIASSTNIFPAKNQTIPQLLRKSPWLALKGRGQTNLNTKFQFQREPKIATTTPKN